MAKILLPCSSIRATDLGGARHLGERVARTAAKLIA